jgi:hypothetical protein
MRAGVAIGLAVFVALSMGIPATAPSAVGATCGRSGYPDADRNDEDSIVDRDLWNELVASGGFSGASEGRDRVSVLIVGPSRNYTVTLRETRVVEYVGGVATNRTTVHLEVRITEGNVTVSAWAFTPVSLAGRGGGNLTLAARLAGDSLTVFWRWAYLECDEVFPNSYYVFHAVLDGDGVSEESALVYFQAPRPRRSPPLDLILLVVAGLAVSVIFLLARHALKRKA